MTTADASSFSARVDRFLRWFFTATPEVISEPRATVVAQGRTVARRNATHLRPPQSGPVRVAVKGKP